MNTRHVSSQIYRLTFGLYNQTLPWSDVRSLTWSELISVLTQHKVGPKQGTCIVPAVFRGTRRHKSDADSIDIAVLDSDSGATLAGIKDAILQCGWAAIVSSTHSHLTTETRVKRSQWEKFRTESRSGASPTDFLVAEKHYLERIARDARLHDHGTEQLLFEHQPCPKFRIAIPLLRPWLASEYKDQRQANAVWKECIEALAAALHLSHDQACTDTSRLFYLPRRPADGPPAETAVLEGALCDIFALPRGVHNQADRHQTRHSQCKEALSHADPETGEVIDLVAWARQHGHRFEFVAALKARCPAVFTGKVVESRHHIRCANEEAHTQAGADAATFIVSASKGANRGFVYHCRHAHCDGRDRLFFLRRMLDQGWLRVADLTDPAFLTDHGKQRPVIQCIPGQLPAVVDQAEQALLTAELDLYQRGSFIVTPGRVRITVPQNRGITTPRILEVGEHALVEAMTKAAAWQRWDARGKKWADVDAPQKVAATYRDRVGKWRLPVLSGIIDAPTLRPDGSVLSTPGYDHSTGLLFDPCGATFPSIPDKPTKLQAQAALTVLLELIETFPFVADLDRSVALSAILTACLRRSLGTAPLHAFTAPTAGSGKSLLVDVVSVIATGREAGVVAQGGSEEELEKRLGALLLAGDLVIAIDNCETPLGGQFLCSMLTQQTVRPRILGRSEVPELPSNAFVTATGNNLTSLADLTRRASLCRLDPKTERPELRIFSNHPTQTAKASRARYLVAALTILRAYHIAGRPQRCEPLGSFEGWSDWVRSALIWLGQADPIGSMDEVRATDPRLQDLTAVLTQWWAVIGSEDVTVSTVIERASAQCTPHSVGGNTYRHPAFREALLAVAGHDGAINGKRLGKWLASTEHRIVQGLRIMRGGVSGGTQRWCVKCDGHAASGQ